MAEPRITQGRARRAIKIGSLASQVGSSYLWDSLRHALMPVQERRQARLETHVRNARRLVESSRQLRGAFMKLVQMLSMRDDLLPVEALELLRTTQSEVPPMDYPLIAQQVRRELGKPPERLFASLETQAFAAASLGQVHRGRLKDGTEVAVKIQYPGVAATVSQDLHNLKLLLRALELLVRDLMRQRIDIRAIYRELEERLLEELNYCNEARNLNQFRALLADDPEVLLPRVVPELSSRAVLTMSYLDGYQLADLFSPEVDLELRRWVALKYYVLVWRQILDFGVLHTDPNPGNYLVTHEPRLGILDFGSIRRFPRAIVRGGRKLARGLVGRDRALIAGALVELGYLDKAQEPGPMVEIVNLVFEPLLVDAPFHPAQYDTVAKAAAVSEIAVKHKLYRSPPHAIFLLRALIGLDGIMRGLGVRANYRAAFKEIVARLDGD